MSNCRDKSEVLFNKITKKNISSNFTGFSPEKNIPINKITIGFLTPQKNSNSKLSITNETKRGNSLNRYENYMFQHVLNAYSPKSNLYSFCKTCENKENSNEKFRTKNKKNKKDSLRKIKPLYNLPNILKNSESPTKIFSLQQTFLDRTTVKNKNKINTNPNSINKKEIIINDPNNNISNSDFMNEKNIKFRKMSGIKKNMNINVINYNKIGILNKNSILSNKMDRKISLSEPHYETEKKSEIPDIERIETVMKDKFYDDTENKMIKKMKVINFNFDSSIKDRIIEINKIGEFWGGFINFCNPLLLNKRLSCIKEKYKRRKQKINAVRNEGELPRIRIKRIKSPLLYTLSSELEYKHEKQKKIENIIKNNEPVKYYIY